MASLLEHKLIVVTGKGGTGKTTMACALGLLGARSGLRTIVAELGDQHRLPALFERSHPSAPGEEIELEPNLWGTSIDPERALFEWLRTLGGRFSTRMLAASSTFHYFAAAAPGAKELVCMVKVRELCEESEELRNRKSYDLVVLDAPATGHALAMLRSPETFATIVRRGPLADQAQGVRELLQDSRRSAYVAVAQGTEMAVSETLELEEGLRRHLDRDLDVVVVNGTVPRRFTREELRRIAIATGDRVLAPLGQSASLVGSAGRMASMVYERARVQQSQIARLRRQRFAEGMPPALITIPFLFTPELDLSGVRDIAVMLERKL
jgi:Anion-transporting ATPase